MPEEKTEVQALYENYQEYNKVLRTWFVTFGIGGPALILTNETVQKQLKAAGQAEEITWLFLFGAGFQILGTLINKVAAYYSYAAADGVIEPTDWRAVAAARVSHWYWIDLFADIGCAGAFAWALLKMFRAFIQ